MEQDKAAKAQQDNLSILAATATQSQTNSHLLKLLSEDDTTKVRLIFILLIFLESPFNLDIKYKS